MAKEQRYFSVLTKIFWGLILVLALFALLKLNPKIFRGEHIAQSIILEDSLVKIDWSEPVKPFKSKRNRTTKENETYITRVWQWNSFDGKSYTLKFRILESDYSQSREFRENNELKDRLIWSSMFHNDREGLQEMVEAYRKIISDNQLIGMDALNMVVSSVQRIPYVKIRIGNCPTFEDEKEYTNDCKPRKNSPYPCCGNVTPYAVYSPIEYAVNACGDCDTKALFACAILKELNLPFYKVAILGGDADGGGHAMIGVNCLNPPYKGLFATNLRQDKYYAWEATGYGCELGQKVWKSWTNWTVYEL